MASGVAKGDGLLSNLAVHIGKLKEWQDLRTEDGGGGLSFLSGRRARFKKAIACDDDDDDDDDAGSQDDQLVWHYVAAVSATGSISMELLETFMQAAGRVHQQQSREGPMKCSYAFIDSDSNISIFDLDVSPLRRVLDT